jgi:phage terminase Nu1 subunit (DNA packaging protein)
MTNEEVLNSWKEVASYMGRGVRTVQRWEQELGLPVRRPRGKSRSAVIAFKQELDQWLHRAPKELLQQTDEDAVTAPRKLKYTDFERQARLHNSTHLLIENTKMLLSRSTDLRERLTLIQERLSQSVHLAGKRVRKAEVVSMNLVKQVPPENDPKPAASHPAKKHAIAS